MRVRKRVGVQRVRNHQAPGGQEGFPNLSSKKFKELPELLVQPQLADVRTVVTLQCTVQRGGSETQSETITFRDND